MTMHARFTRLAVTAIDFHLAPGDRRELAGHLDSCAECRAIADAYGKDAAMLRYGAVVHAPDRVRAAVLGEAARRPPARPAWHLLLAAALALALLSAAAFAAGALRQILDGPPDPITWRALSVEGLPAGGEGLTLQRVAAGNDRIVAIGQAAGAPVALVSPDGASWTRVEAFEEAVLLDVTFVEGGPHPRSFVAMGSLDQVPTVWWSSDGMDWTPERLPGERGDVIAVDAWDAVVVAIASVVAPEDTSLEPAPGPEPEPGRILAAWRSTVAGRWETGSINGEASTDDGVHAALTHTEAGFAGVTAAGFMVSATGDSWQTSTDTRLPGKPGALAWSGGTYVASASGPDAAVLRVSIDGQAWADATLPESGGAVIADVAARDGRFLAVGSGHRGVMTWHSDDARSWRSGAPVPAGDGALIADLAWAGTGVLAIGAAGSGAAIWFGEVEDR